MIEIADLPEFSPSPYPLPSRERAIRKGDIVGDDAMTCSEDSRGQMKKREASKDG